jgi:hypothetical protein
MVLQTSSLLTVVIALTLHTTTLRELTIVSKSTYLVFVWICATII